MLKLLFNAFSPDDDSVKCGVFFYRMQRFNGWSAGVFFGAYSIGLQYIKDLDAYNTYREKVRIYREKLRKRYDKDV